MCKSVCDSVGCTQAQLHKIFRAEMYVFELLVFGCYEKLPLTFPFKRNTELHLTDQLGHKFCIDTNDDVMMKSNV